MKTAPIKDTYWIKDFEYTVCCNYGVDEIQDKTRKKVRRCNQCLKELKPKE